MILKSTLSAEEDSINICHTNAQSLVPKIEDVLQIFYKSDMHVICVFDTWHGIKSKSIRITG